MSQRVKMGERRRRQREYRALFTVWHEYMTPEARAIYDALSPDDKLILDSFAAELNGRMCELLRDAQPKIPWTDEPIPGCVVVLEKMRADGTLK